MPSKRISHNLLSAINVSYANGKGGYNEVAVPTINLLHKGTFGTGSEVGVNPWAAAKNTRGVTAVLDVAFSPPQC